MHSLFKYTIMKLTQRKAILVVAILVVLACSFAVYLRLFTGEELWYEMFAAVLGVIITAVITMILLKGQSDDDVERERAAKIFGEKLRIYQDYLHTLCDVIKDNALSDEEKTRLEFQTSYVAMHCDPKYIATVSNAVKKLIECCCPDEDTKKSNREKKSGAAEPLLDNLFCIVEAFRKDLYGDDFKFDDKHKQNTLENFSNAYRNAKSTDRKQEQQRITVDLNVLSNSLANAGIDANSEPNGQDSNQQVEKALIEDTSIWDEALAKWKEEGWQVEGMSDQYDGFRMTEANGDPGVIEVGFWQEHYYIQAEDGGDPNFSKALKWEKGGRRSYGKWWQDLAEPYCDIAQGKFVETFRSNKELQQYIVDNVKELKGIINQHHRTMTWLKEVGTYENWEISTWYWEMLVCQLSSGGENTLYMDIIEDGDSGKVLIQFDNRNGDREMLKNALKRMGCQDKEVPTDGYILLDVVPSTDASAVAEKVKYWIEKINGACPIH